MFFKSRCSVIIVIFFFVIDVVTNEVNTEIDYTVVAREAEVHKNDLLNFLNETRVKKIYKSLYDSLLARLLGLGGGQRHRRPDSSGRRMVAGQNTSITAVPWQASLRENNSPICGGSVVTDTWIVTAAHCVIKSRPMELSVRLGSSWKSYGGVIYEVKESLVHPRYNMKSKANDVGLVRLYTSLRFSNRIMPISLVNRDSRLPADQYTIVSGWGKLKEGGDSPSYLQSSTMKTISMKQCRGSGLDRRAIDPDTMFCVGYFLQNQPDACQGDSGGPIVSDGVLIGVVSWGLGCARGNFPGVYTRLASHVLWDWVHTHITRPYDYNTTV